jgi:hypothetical protein
MDGPTHQRSALPSLRQDRRHQAVTQPHYPSAGYVVLVRYRRRNERYAFQVARTHLDEFVRMLRRSRRIVGITVMPLNRGSEFNTGAEITGDWSPQ